MRKQHRGPVLGKDTLKIIGKMVNWSIRRFPGQVKNTSQSWDSGDFRITLTAVRKDGK